MLRNPLFIPPDSMSRWNLQIKSPMTTNLSQWVIVDIQQAFIEQHHEALLLDENERPIDAWVVFGYPGGNGTNIPGRMYTRDWMDYPEMNGNPQYTTNGYARHTFNAGGEHIYVVEHNNEGRILTPSCMLKNCIWLSSTKEGVRFLHTGVRVTFQRHRTDVPVYSLRDFDRRISDLEAKMRERI